MSAAEPIKVLVVEDSAAVRRVITDALGSDRDIKVLGTAANGKLGLVELQRLNPDIITLDIEMPEMDGLTMLTELRKTHPRLPVIMVSTLTGRGAAATLDALARGASDYVTKPSSATANSAGSAIEHFRRELIPRVKALCPRRAPSIAPLRTAGSLAARPALGARPALAGATASPIGVARPRVSTAKFELLAIGCSTGGPNALEMVLHALPGDLPVPVMVTQHMPPMFTKMLADRLDTKCALHVVEAEDGMPLTAGTVYIAPGDFHMVTHGDGMTATVRTNKAPAENSCRPAVDVMFRSIATSFGSRCLAVVMTGMGYDGRVGAAAIVKAGGEVLAQDEATSVVWGMPRAVAEAGLASEILPLAQIPSAIEQRIGRRMAARPAAPTSHLAGARP